MGSISNLFIKTQRKIPMVEVDSLNLVKFSGIENDINSSKFSPRQVLLADLQTMLDFKIKPGDFRENITIKDFDLNNLKSGTVLKIGTTAKLRITFTCEPCGYINTLNIKNAGNILGKRGMLAIVLESGNININNKVEIDNDNLFSEVPFRFSDRFNWVVSKIPEGKVMTYFTLLEAIGGANSYIRAFPALIRRGIKLGLPTYRILDSKGNFITHVQDQSELLLSEGINISELEINLKKYLWNPQDLYL